MTTYMIVRRYQNAFDGEVVERGLSLEEAQAHCRNPETSSKTATSSWAVALTEKRGPWFDGYEDEDCELEDLPCLDIDAARGLFL